MQHIIDYKFPLADLFSVLKSSGYEISVEQILEIQTVLLSSPVLKWDPADLKFVIAPVIARNEDEQENIYKIIDSFIANKRESDERRPTRFQRLLQNRQLIFRLKLAGFILAFLTGVLLYISQRENKRRYPADMTQYITPDTLQKAPKDNPDLTAPKTSPDSLPETSGANLPVITYSGRSIAAKHPDINLQLSVAFGIGLGAILYHLIFFERRKRMELKKKKSQEDEQFLYNEGGGNPVKKPAKEEWTHTQVQFPQKDFLIQKSPEFLAIRTYLKKPAPAEYVNLDVRESAFATARNAGFPSLVFDNEWKERKYLVLSDNKNEEAHSNHLFGFLIRFIEADKIPVAKYTYEKDITTLRDVNRKIIRLEDLSLRFADYHLIIIGDCASLLNPPDEEHKNIFTRWSSRSVITPLPLPDWSDREEQLANSGFQIVPAEINAVKSLTKAITENSVVKRKLLEKQIGELYSVSAIDFNSPEKVREYLNNESLFQIVCSLAVYPRLNWSLTLVLFSSIMKRSGNNEVTKPDYDTLLKISRIPWLNSGKLDELVRLQFLNYLNPKVEIIARETILELLDQMKPVLPRQSLAYKELEIQYKLNSFFLFAHDQNEYKKYADIKDDIHIYWDHLDEWAIKERVKSGQSGLMPENKEGRRINIDEFILEEQKIEKVNITFLRVVLLTLPAIILYILFSLFRPGFIYVPGKYEPVSFLVALKKDSACERQLTHAVIITNKPDTVPLKKLDAIDYIPVRDATYDREIRFLLLSGDSTAFDFSITAIDSAATVSVKCSSRPVRLPITLPTP